MAISDTTLDHVKQLVQIEDVVSDFLSLKKKGKDLWACCPFHEEKSASFSVAPHKGFYKCFGCGAKGDAFTFLQQAQGMGFEEAVRYIAQKYSIPVEEKIRSAAAQAKHSEKEQHYQLMQTIAAYYHDLLAQPVGQQAQAYLTQRGITTALCQEFTLGYSAPAWDSMLKHAKNQEYDAVQLERVGLVIRKEARTYDRFRNRIIFPIQNLAGKVVAFAGRILSAQGDQAKYINSPETSLYHKGDHLYGLFQAKQAIKTASSCYIVEGYTDVLALHSAGLKNVVATAGTALTIAQIKLLRRFTQHVVLLFDGDSAGQAAALRGVDLFLAEGLAVEVVLLPAGHDPASYAEKKSQKGLKNYCAKHVQDFLAFKGQLLLDEAGDDPHRRTAAIRGLVQSIAYMPDPIQRNVYLASCAKKLGIPLEVLTAAEQQLQCTVQGKSKETIRHQLSVEAPQPTSARIACERELLYLWLKYGDQPLTQQATTENGVTQQEPVSLVGHLLLKELAEIDFIHPPHAAVRTVLAQAYEEATPPDLRLLIMQQPPAAQGVMIDLLTREVAISKGWESRYQIWTLHEKHHLRNTTIKAILRLKQAALQQLLHENQCALQAAKTEAEEHTLLQVHQQLKTLECTISQQLGRTIIAP